MDIHLFTNPADYRPAPFSSFAKYQQISIETSMSVVSYNDAFIRVTSKRLTYAHKLNGILSIFITFLLSFPYERIQNSLVGIIYRAPVIFASCYLIKILRDKLSTVNYPTLKTFVDRVFHAIFGKNFVIGLCLYLASGLIISTMHLFQLSFTYNYYELSKEYQQRPIVNDSWVFYWFATIYSAIIYSLQFFIFQRNRLQYKSGVLKVNPQDVLFQKVPLFIGVSIVLTIFVSISSPIVYFFGHSLVYKLIYLPILILGLDTSTPHYNVSFEAWVSSIYLSFWLVFLWELVNHIYQVYVTIGCLDKSKPISAACEEPIRALLVAVQDIRPESQLCRLTAFQELAYYSTTKEPSGVKIRATLYESNNRSGALWQQVFEECSLLIREATLRISYRSPLDLRPSAELKNDRIENWQGSGDDIFGNTYTRSQNTHSNPIHAIPTSEQNKKNNNTKTTPENAYSFILSLVQLQIVTPLKSIFSSLELNETVHDKEKSLGKLIATKVNEIKKRYDQKLREFLFSAYGTPFRVSLERDAESRVINPVNLGNAAIALANFLIHAIEQDKNSTITNTQVSEVMNLLELPISACSEYSRNVPNSVYKQPYQQTNKHMIAYIHDLFMSEFFQICIKYNHKLNDLLLTSGCFKLAKLVVDVAIAENQNNA